MKSNLTEKNANSSTDTFWSLLQYTEYNIQYKIVLMCKKGI